MIRSILLLLVTSFLAKCEITFYDGYCPNPEPEERSKLTKLDGNWWEVQSSKEELEQNPVTCANFFIAYENNDLKGNRQYKDSKFKDHSEKTKYVMINDHPGKRARYLLNDTNGQYEPDGWLMTGVKAVGKDKELAMLIYFCKQSGNKHRSFYRIISKKIPVDKKALKTLLEALKATGDKRPLISTANKDCK